MKLLHLRDQELDPFPALALLKSIDADKSRPQHSTTQPNRLMFLVKKFQKCSELLDASGHSEEAEWVKQASYKHFASKLESMRQQRAPCREIKYNKNTKMLEAKYRSDTDPTPDFSDTII